MHLIKTKTGTRGGARWNPDPEYCQKFSCAVMYPDEVTKFHPDQRTQLLKRQRGSLECISSQMAPASPTDVK